MFISFEFSDHIPWVNFFSYVPHPRDILGIVTVSYVDVVCFWWCATAKCITLYDIMTKFNWWACDLFSPCDMTWWELCCSTLLAGAQNTSESSSLAWGDKVGKLNIMLATWTKLIIVSIIQWTEIQLIFKHYWCSITKTLECLFFISIYRSKSFYFFKETAYSIWQCENPLQNVASFHFALVNSLGCRVVSHFMSAS